MKKCMLIALITIFTLSVFGSFCCAQLDRTVTNTSKKGSLVIWPLVKVGSGATNTVIKLSNDYYIGVKVKCTYRYSFPFQHTDWVFTLLPNQEVSWVASTGKGVGLNTLNAIGNPPPLNPGVAELRCWAVDDAEVQQIAWNWLAGEAIVIESNASNWEYSAWRFAVNSSTTGATAGTAGTIQLTGDSGNYDTCPTALQFNFLKQTPSASGDYPKGTVNNVLTLIPCAENYKINTFPIVYSELVVRDENHNLFSGTYICVGCTSSASQWFSDSLISSKLHLPVGGNPFTTLATPGGSIYVHGRNNSLCTGSTGVPLLGVMSMQFSSSGSGVFVGEAPTAIGPGQGYVKDASDDYLSPATPITINW